MKARNLTPFTLLRGLLLCLVASCGMHDPTPEPPPVPTGVPGQRRVHRI